ncbi:MAG: DUF1398 domain-containing protein [Pseudomonadota bacterium]
MNTAQIAKLASASMSGSMPFPQIVSGLLGEGVESYHVDYRALHFTFYGVSSGVVVVPLIFERLPEIAERFDAPALRAAILDNQKKGQAFRDFCSRAILAGVHSYHAFLRGKRVVYLGRHGDQHVEWFPGAAPADV